MKKWDTWGPTIQAYFHKRWDKWGRAGNLAFSPCLRYPSDSDIRGKLGETIRVRLRSNVLLSWEQAYFCTATATTKTMHLVHFSLWGLPTKRFHWKYPLRICDSYILFTAIKWHFSSQKVTSIRYLTNELLVLWIPFSKSSSWNH